MNRRAEMKIITVIQARMLSQRLPGKVLMPLSGRPMLLHVLNQVERCEMIDAVVVSTSNDASDKPVAAFCDSRGTSCYTGPLDNVAQRLMETIECFDADAIVRISGDSPCIDFRLIDQCVSKFRSGTWDVVTNVRPRSFPTGHSVEVFSANALRSAMGAIVESFDQEHVGPFFYVRPEQYRIFNVTGHPNCNGLRFTIDTVEDFEIITKFLASLAQPLWTYDVYAMCDHMQAVLKETV